MIILEIYLLFWIYSILGWIMEVIDSSIRNKRFINRGFLLGPYCPIYGTGGVLLLTINDYQSNPLIVFVLSIVICSLVEYLASYFMELIYKVRWWDYSNRLFNLNGRVCLFNSICFGLLGMLMVCYINPYFLDIIDNMNNILRLILIIIIFIITTLDMIITFNAMFDIRKTVVNFKERTLTSLFKTNTDNTEEISKKVRNIIKDKTFIHKHLTNSYSNFKIYKNNFNRKKDEISNFKLKEKLENRYIIGSIISILIGYILGLIFNNISICIVICFVIGLIIIRCINGK